VKNLLTLATFKRLRIRQNSILNTSLVIESTVDVRGVPACRHHLTCSYPLRCTKSTPFPATLHTLHTPPPRGGKFLPVRKPSQAKIE